MFKPKYQIVDEEITDIVTEDEDYRASEDVILYYTINGAWIYYVSEKKATFIPKAHVWAVHVKVEDKPNFGLPKSSNSSFEM